MTFIIVLIMAESYRADVVEVFWLVGWLVSSILVRGVRGGGGGFLRTDLESVNGVCDTAEDVSCEFWSYGHDACSIW